MPFQRLNEQDLQLYLQRIRCDENLSATLSALEIIHRLHPLHIPFENLDTWLGVPVALVKDELVKKIAAQQRGGYCFEHNLLLGHVLATLGFAVQGLSARVSWMLPPEIVLARTHMALLITLGDTRYLADVGFGGLTLTAPLRLDTDAPQPTSHETFRITQKDANFTLSVQLNDIWQDMYSFTLDPQLQPDYEMANWYIATHPESRFINSLIAGKVADDGRHALLNQRYTRHYVDKPSEKIELASAAELLAILHEQFHIETADLPGLDARLAKLFDMNS